MKLTRKLIPAFAMLLISAVLMSTASFAWFSMNETVRVYDMTVTAKKTEDIFLEISNDGSSFGLEATNGLSETTLLPIAHKAWSGVADIEKFDKDGDDEEDNWYYKVGTDADSSEATGSEQYVSTFAGYVAKTTYKVRANPNTLQTIYDLHVSHIKITLPSGEGGVTVVVAGKDGFHEFTADDNGDVTFDEDIVLFETLGTDATEQTVTVYIYIDGNHEDVFTNNRDKLGGTVEFTLKAYDAAQ